MDERARARALMRFVAREPRPFSPSSLPPLFRTGGRVRGLGDHIEPMLASAGPGIWEEQEGGEGRGAKDDTKGERKSKEKTTRPGGLRKFLRCRRRGGFPGG